MPASRRPCFSRVHYAREFLFLGMHDMKVKSTIPMAWRRAVRRVFQRGYLRPLRIFNFAGK